jgi:two-component system, NtrC family, response regulator AtoC
MGLHGKNNGGFVMIGQSLPMRRIMSLIERVASSDLPVLITGETGTGKEVTAQLIHQLSSRRNGPFLPVNCAAIPDTLIESHLFGHERGAFTGADRRQEGFFGSATGGTILLDEFTEIRCEAQAKLLRVLEEGKVLRVGATRETPVDVRVLAASNRPIEKAVQNGALREDLLSSEGFPCSSSASQGAYRGLAAPDRALHSKDEREARQADNRSR